MLLRAFNALIQDKLHVFGNVKKYIWIKEYLLVFVSCACHYCWHQCRLPFAQWKENTTKCDTKTAGWLWTGFACRDGMLRAYYATIVRVIVWIWCEMNAANMEWDSAACAADFGKWSFNYTEHRTIKRLKRIKQKIKGEKGDLRVQWQNPRRWRSLHTFAHIFPLLLFAVEYSLCSLNKMSHFTAWNFSHILVTQCVAAVSMRNHRKVNCMQIYVDPMLEQLFRIEISPMGSTLKLH